MLLNKSIHGKSISIIVATYNAGKYLQTCLQSIITQKSERIELLIIDGGSIDNTVSIINKNKDKIDYWCSESDKGIYDAWNKGVKFSKGKWVMFLGADDLLLPGALEAYTIFLEKNGEDFDIISSKLDYVTESGAHLKYVGEPWDWIKLKNGKMSFAHPGMLHNARLFISNGAFDTSFKICGDLEFLLRTKNNIKASYLSFVTVRMQQGGISYSLKAILESYQIRKKNQTLSTTKNFIGFLVLLLKFALSKVKKTTITMLYK